MSSLSQVGFNISSCARGILNYLTPAPWTVLSQGMQDDFGAKSANWVDFIFNFIFLTSVRGKQAIFAQLHSFAKLEEFQ